MNLEDDILIEKFFQRQLSQYEEKAFLKRMKIDVAFKDTVILEKQLRETLNESDWGFIDQITTEVESYEDIFKSDQIKKLKTVIENVSTASQTPKKHIFRRNWIFYASAAAIALIMTISILYTSPSPQDLYARYLRGSELPSYVTREDSNENSLLKAQQLFEKKEYAQALVIFEKELKISNDPDAGIYLYIGTAHMHLNEFVQAEASFDTLISSDLIDAQKGYWFKALLYLKMEQLEKSKVVLEEIIRGKLYNYKQAQKLLNKLD